MKKNAIKRFFFILLGMLFMVAGSIEIVSAESKKPFATAEEIKQLISEVISPIQTVIDSLGQRLLLIETIVTSNTQEIQSLSSRISTLENNQGAQTPDFISNITTSTICHNPNVSDFEDQWRIKLQFENKLNGQAYQSSGITIWSVFHLPSGDILASGNNDYLERGSITDAQMPPEGTVINTDVYSFFAGKTVHINTNIDNWAGFCPSRW